MRTYGNPPISEEEYNKRLDEIRAKGASIPLMADTPDEEKEKNLEAWGKVQKEITEFQDKYTLNPPEKSYVITKIGMCGGACPFQVEALTDDGKEVYARFRSGFLRVDIDGVTIYAKQLDYGEDEDHSIEFYKSTGLNEEQAKSAQRSNELMKLMNGGYVSYLGTMSYEQLVEATKGYIEWPNQD